MEQTPLENQELSAEQLSELLQVRRDKLNNLIEQGKNPFEVTSFNQTHHSRDIVAAYDELEGREVSIAGRMMSKRIMGKASFAHVLDGQGDIQIYVKRTMWVRKIMPPSRPGTSVTSLALRASYSRPAPAKSPSMQRIYSC